MACWAFASLGFSAGAGWARGMVRGAGPFGGKGGFFPDLLRSMQQPFGLDGVRRPFWRVLPGISRDPMRASMGSLALLAGVSAGWAGADLLWLPGLCVCAWMSGLLAAADRGCGEVPLFALCGLFWGGLLLNPLLSPEASLWGAFGSWALLSVAFLAGRGNSGLGEGDVFAGAALGAWLGPVFGPPLAVGVLASVRFWKWRDCPVASLLCCGLWFGLGVLPWWL